MANKIRYRDEDFDDDFSKPSSDKAGPVIASVFASVFGLWATIIGTLGLIYVVFFLCVMGFFLLVFCIIGTILFTAMSRVPPPAPIINQPTNPPPNIPPINFPPIKQPPEPVEAPDRK